MAPGLTSNLCISNINIPSNIQTPRCNCPQPNTCFNTLFRFRSNSRFLTYYMTLKIGPRTNLPVFVYLIKIYHQIYRPRGVTAHSLYMCFNTLFRFRSNCASQRPIRRLNIQIEPRTTIIVFKCF